MVLSDLHVEPKRLEEISKRYRVARLEVFGSFARGDAGPESDLDMLVTFEADARIGFEFITLK